MAGSLRDLLLARGGSCADKREDDEIKVDVDVDAPRTLRNRKSNIRKYNLLDGDDDEYFEMLEKGTLDRPKAVEQDVAELGRQHRQRENGMRMKICVNPN